MTTASEQLVGSMKVADLCGMLGVTPTTLVEQVTLRQRGTMREKAPADIQERILAMYKHGQALLTLEVVASMPGVKAVHVYNAIAGLRRKGRLVRTERGVHVRR